MPRPCRQRGLHAEGMIGGQHGWSRANEQKPPGATARETGHRWGPDHVVWMRMGDRWDSIQDVTKGSGEC